MAKKTAPRKPATAPGRAAAQKRDVHPSNSDSDSGAEPSPSPAINVLQLLASVQVSIQKIQEDGHQQTCQWGTVEKRVELLEAQLTALHTTLQGIQATLTAQVQPAVGVSTHPSAPGAAPSGSVPVPAPSAPTPAPHAPAPLPAEPAPAPAQPTPAPAQRAPAAAQPTPTPAAPALDPAGPVMGPPERRKRLVFRNMGVHSSHDAVAAFYAALSQVQGEGLSTAMLQRVKVDAAFVGKGGSVVILQFSTILDRDAVLRSARYLAEQTGWRIQTDETPATRAARVRLNPVHQQLFEARLRPQWKGAQLFYRQASGQFAEFNPDTDTPDAVIHAHATNQGTPATGANSTPQGPAVAPGGAPPASAPEPDHTPQAPQPAVAPAGASPQAPAGVPSTPAPAANSSPKGPAVADAEAPSGAPLAPPLPAVPVASA